jgi:hypothetical protein
VLVIDGPALRRSVSPSVIDLPDDGPGFVGNAMLLGGRPR